MSARHVLGLGLLLAAVSGGVGCGAGCPAPEGPRVPMGFVSEEADEWLHDNCRVVQVLEGCATDAQNAATRGGGNFVELVYRSSHWNIAAVVFACASAPPPNLTATMEQQSKERAVACR